MEKETKQADFLQLNFKKYVTLVLYMHNISQVIVAIVRRSTFEMQKAN